MDFITPAQCRAARALLNWSQPDLAKRCGIHIQTISSFEIDKGSPTKKTLTMIKQILELNGIDFTRDGGVRPTSHIVQVYEGEDCYMKFIAEAHIYLTHRKGEILFSGADDRRSPPEIIQKFRTMLADGIRMRSLIRPGDDYVLGEPSAYRWMPEGLFVEGDVKAIFADRVAWLVSWLDNPRVIMIKDPMISQEATRMFEYLWSMAEGPQSSSAPEKY